MVEFLHISHGLPGVRRGQRQRCFSGGCLWTLCAHKTHSWPNLLLVISVHCFNSLPVHPCWISTEQQFPHVIFLFERCIQGDTSENKDPCLVSCPGVAQRIRVWWRLLFRWHIWATGQNLPVHSEPDLGWQECLARSGHTTWDDIVWSDVIWQGLLFSDVLNCCFSCILYRMWGRGKGGFYSTWNSSICWPCWVWQNVPQEGWDNR